MDAGSSMQYPRGMTREERGLKLARLLKTCAKYTETNDIMNAGAGLKKIAALASPDGDALQRVATYVNKGLAYRLIKDIRGVPEALQLTNPLSTSEKQYGRKLFSELCPFLKFAYATTNQAIAGAMEREKLVHIIDLNACDPAQWINLLHTMKEQWQGNPLPFLKITGIHEKKEVLEQMECRLMEEAKKLNFPFHFYPIVSKLDNLCIENLPVKPGEPLAISSIFQLHSLLAIDDQISPDTVLTLNSSQCASPKIDCFLNGLWKLQPRLMVITEQELNTNRSTLTDRLENTLMFYAALFDCLEANVPEARAVERIILERMLLGEEIKNIIACEGAERKERHEKVMTWIPSLELAGFIRVPVSYERMLQATRPLQSYGRGYKLLEDNQCLFICWNDQPLYSISAWRF